MKDETGKEYGRLKVLRVAHKRRGREFGWVCECSCGTVFETRGSSLRNGTTTSCGCIATEKLKERITLPRGQAARNTVLRSFKYSAKMRNIPWGLADADAIRLAEKPCYYCGNPAGNLSAHPEQNGTYAYNGLDRVDSDKGYTLDNVVSCCKHCNYAKRDRSTSEFLNWIKQVASHLHL